MIEKVHIKGYRTFTELIYAPNPGLNIIVGANEAGKSTLIEAISLALTGRINGNWAATMIDPYWFNQDNVKHFFSNIHNTSEHIAPPEFRIDIYLKTTDRDLYKLEGMNNMQHENATGISIWAHPDPDYKEELNAYLSDKTCPPIIPTEFYTLDWFSFSGAPIYRKLKQIGISVIDEKTIDSHSGIDFYTKEIIRNKVDIKQLNSVSAEHRKIRGTIGSNLLRELNEQIRENARESQLPIIGLQVDQSKSSTWDNTLIPDINDIPIKFAGQGSQALAKTSLALKQQENTDNYIFIEEPENHLSHTTLRKLISFIDSTANGRQIFITTHSSYVLNRLGLNHLAMLSTNKITRICELSKETANYFKRLSGFDTLRFLLSEFVVVVEGPSDEIIFNRLFEDRFHNPPDTYGIDVIAVNGTSFARCFELANLFDRQLFALRDNDGKDPHHWVQRLAQFTNDGIRRLFVGDVKHDTTLEKQICRTNDVSTIQAVSGRQESKEAIEKWMLDNKVSAALKIAESRTAIKPPLYFEEALNAIEKLVRPNR